TAERIAPTAPSLSSNNQMLLARAAARRFFNARFKSLFPRTLALCDAQCLARFVIPIGPNWNFVFPENNLHLAGFFFHPGTALYGPPIRSWALVRPFDPRWEYQHRIPKPDFFRRQMLLLFQCFPHWMVSGQGL